MWTEARCVGGPLDGEMVRVDPDTDPPTISVAMDQQVRFDTAAALHRGVQGRYRWDEATGTLRWHPQEPPAGEQPFPPDARCECGARFDEHDGRPFVCGDFHRTKHA